MLLKNKIEDYNKEELLVLRDAIEKKVRFMSYTMLPALLMGLLVLFLGLGLRNPLGIVLGLAFLVAAILMLFTILNYTVKSATISLYRAIKEEMRQWEELMRNKN